MTDIVTPKQRLDNPVHGAFVPPKKSRRRAFRGAPRDWINISKYYRRVNIPISYTPVFFAIAVFTYENHQHSYHP
jgi:hypothetical protein